MREQIFFAIGAANKRFKHGTKVPCGVKDENQRHIRG